MCAYVGAPGPLGTIGNTSAYAFDDLRGQSGDHTSGMVSTDGGTAARLLEGVGGGARRNLGIGIRRPVGVGKGLAVGTAAPSPSSPPVDAPDSGGVLGRAFLSFLDLFLDSALLLALRTFGGRGGGVLCFFDGERRSDFVVPSAQTV